jgi:hypothetical protein
VRNKVGSNVLLTPLERLAALKEERDLEPPPDPFERLAVLEEAVEELLDAIAVACNLDNMPHLAGHYQKVKALIDGPAQAEDDMDWPAQHALLGRL